MSARVMISAPSGRSGKTIITTGICALFKKRGLVVQPFKKGPDYIDPSWLTAASNRPCRNLDLFMMKKDTILKSFYKFTADVDIAVIEANMGFYDGINKNGTDSPAGLARLLDCPTVLVINPSRMTRSVAALIKGYTEFEPNNHIKGVILNNVSGIRHEKKLLDSIKRHCGIPVLGSVPKSSALNIKERHLGLIHFKENGHGEEIISQLADFLEHYIDLDGILSLARDVTDIKYHKATKKIKTQAKTKKVVKIGVFYSKAFSFYYPENLEALESKGADLVFIDPIKDALSKDIDGLYIGGGFPELYCHELAQNTLIMRQLVEAIENYMPVYCECAGLMYLSQGIKIDNGFYKMVGMIPKKVEKKTRPHGHGYMEVEVIEENPFLKKGKKIKGHEFHYSTLMDHQGLNYALKVKRGYGIDGNFDGIIYKNMFSSYMHIHALSVIDWAKNFVNIAMAYKNKDFYRERLKKGGYCHVR